MYLDKAYISNFRSIEDLEWDLGSRPRAGWHVAVGDNGTGKSSFLRAISLALLGSRESEAVIVDWGACIREGSESSRCELQLTRDAQYDWFFHAKKPKHTAFFAAIEVQRYDSGQVGAGDTVPELTSDGTDRLGIHETRYERADGWFSAAYGPFRRFTGGDREQERRLLARPSGGRHMSVFREDVALTEPIEWLLVLYREAVDDPAADARLRQIKTLINQEDFLPNDVRLEKITAKDVLFRDGQGATVRIADLSDGYRSVLCMTLELIRQLTAAYPNVSIFNKNGAMTVVVPGIVLIDEVDVHLHPTWQREIGLWFRKHFPNIQFIVTSHSPLVCQAAEHGTVFALPNHTTEQYSGFVEGAALDRLLYGDILDAYSTNLFGDASARSDEALERLERLAALNTKARHRKLTKNEQGEWERLKTTFVSMPALVSQNGDAA